ncbi:hypothetical protein ACLESO_57795 [Pyxidicoccus sp. 3LG]
MNTGADACPVGETTIVPCATGCAKAGADDSCPGFTSTQQRFSWNG